MLHDMGKLLLFQALSELNDNWREMNETNIMEIIDAQHMAFGAAQMRKWNIPIEFCYTAEQHHTIAEGGKYSQEFMIVCLANMIARKPGYSLKEDIDGDLALTYPARVLEVDATTIDLVTDEMKYSQVKL